MSLYGIRAQITVNNLFNKNAETLYNEVINSKS